MTVTPPDWRVQLRKGDVLRASGTYDTRRASWYESMAIMPTMWVPGGTGADPFTTDVDVKGEVTHGHLPENDNHGGGRHVGPGEPARAALAARARKRREGRDPGLRLRPGRPQHDRQARPPGAGAPGAAG